MDGRALFGARGPRSFGIVAGAVSSRVRGLPVCSCRECSSLVDLSRAGWRAAGPTLSCARRCVVGCSDLLVRGELRVAVVVSPARCPVSWFVVALCFCLARAACPAASEFDVANGDWCAHACPVRLEGVRRRVSRCARTHMDMVAHLHVCSMQRRGGTGRASVDAGVCCARTLPFYLALCSNLA